MENYYRSWKGQLVLESLIRSVGEEYDLDWKLTINGGKWTIDGGKYKIICWKYTISYLKV